MIGYDTIARYVRLGIDKVKSVVYPNRDGSSIDQIIQQPFRVHSGASRGLLYAGAATAVILGLVYVVGCGREDGEVINPSLLIKAGDLITVSGTSKGKGFQGGVKRHGFKGRSHTHGASRDERAPGSIGMTTTPGRVFKGKRHMFFI